MPIEVQVNLKEINHRLQMFEDAGAPKAARVSNCDGLEEELRHIKDAVTSKSLLPRELLQFHQSRKVRQGKPHRLGRPLPRHGPLASPHDGECVNSVLQWFSFWGSWFVSQEPSHFVPPPRSPLFIQLVLSSFLLGSICPPFSYSRACLVWRRVWRRHSSALCACIFPCVCVFPHFLPCLLSPSVFGLRSLSFTFLVFVVVMLILSGLLYVVFLASPCCLASLWLLSSLLYALVVLLGSFSSLLASTCAFP